MSKVIDINSVKDQLQVKPHELLNLAYNDVKDDPTIKSVIIMYQYEKEGVLRFNSYRCGIKWADEVAILSKALHTAIQR